MPSSIDIDIDFLFIWLTQKVLNLFFITLRKQWLLKQNFNQFRENKNLYFIFSNPDFEKSHNLRVYF